MKLTPRETDAIVKYVLDRFIAAMGRDVMVSYPAIARWIRAAIKQLDKRGKG